jgi:DNA gyrase subunit B
MATPQQPIPQRQQIAEDIQALKGLEAIRLRPGMYVGASPDAIYNMADEVLDCAIDEAMAGYCDHIEITIHPDSSMTISDNGSGIPVAMHPTLGISQLEAVLTMIFAGRRSSEHPYTATGGMHGVGLKAVNALSEWFIAEVRRDGYLWRQSYARGVRTSDVEKVRPLNDTESTGTTITFYPDADIFPDLRSGFDFDYDILLKRFRQIAYLLPGITVRFTDQREKPFPREATFCFESGLETFVRDLNRNRVPLHAVVSGMKTAHYDKGRPNKDTIEVEVALQYTDDAHTTEVLFVNTVETPDGGSHQVGLRTGITRTINKWARKMGYLRTGDDKFTGRDVRKGLTAVVSVKHPNPQFASMTKVILENPEVHSIVASAVSGVLAELLESHHDAAQRIFDNCRASEDV